MYEINLREIENNRETDPLTSILDIKWLWTWKIEGKLPGLFFLPVFFSVDCRFYSAGDHFPPHLNLPRLFFLNFRSRSLYCLSVWIDSRGISCVLKGIFGFPERKSCTVYYTFKMRRIVSYWNHSIHGYRPLESATGGVFMALKRKFSMFSGHWNDIQEPAFLDLGNGRGGLRGIAYPT